MYLFIFMLKNEIKMGYLGKLFCEIKIFLKDNFNIWIRIFYKR